MIFYDINYFLQIIIFNSLTLFFIVKIHKIIKGKNMKSGCEAKATRLHSYEFHLNTSEKIFQFVLLITKIAKNTINKILIKIKTINFLLVLQICRIKLLLRKYWK